MSQSQPSEKLASDLCVSCGMCCDGTLFGFVPVSDEESARVSDLGFTLTAKPNPKDVGVCFTQPCRALSGTSCTIYHDRPSVCRAYRCVTLEAFNAGDIAIEEARKRVSDVLESRKDLLKATGTTTFHDARTAIDEAVRNDAKTAKAIPAHSFLVVIIERMLDLHFRRGKERRTMPRQSPAES